jgi:vesicle coat complex subunit
MQVYERIKAPLMTLVSSGSSEQSYAVLCHLHLLVMRAPILFSSDYKHFYCRYSDPSYIKKLKLEMLTAVANESNTYEIGMTSLLSLVMGCWFLHNSRLLALPAELGSQIHSCIDIVAIIEDDRM